MQVYSCISSEALNRLWSTIDDTSLYSGKKKPRVDFRSCGRYASSTLNIADTVVMVGGMVSCSDSHTVTSSIRRLRISGGFTKKIYWEGPVYTGDKTERSIKLCTPVQNSIQQRKKFSDEIFIILASITLILIRIIEFEIKTKGNFEKIQFTHFK